MWPCVASLTKRYCVGTVCVCLSLTVCVCVSECLNVSECVSMGMCVCVGMCELVIEWARGHHECLYPEVRGHYK